MKDLIEEAKEIMNETEDDLVRDAGIIAAAQRSSTMRSLRMGCFEPMPLLWYMTKLPILLEETLNEEKEADEALTKLRRSMSIARP